MKAIFIDTFTRDLKVSLVSVSQVEDRGLVIRFGAEIAPLWQMTVNSANRVFENPGLPILVAVRGYQAKSSEGFVKVISGNGNDFHRNFVIGIQGMPWQKNKGLAVVASPIEVLVLRPETNIVEVSTHASRRGPGGQHSNASCAEAALEAMKTKAVIQPNYVFVAEGQSDYCRGWEFSAYHEHYSQPFRPVFLAEFRDDRFTHEAMLRAALRAHARRNSSKKEVGAIFFIHCNLLLADGPFWHDTCWTEQLVPWHTRRVVGDNLAPIVDTIAAEMRQDGWKLGINTEVSNHFLQAISPQGEVAAEGWWSAIHGPKEWERGLIGLADALSEEERADLLKELDAQNPKDRGWLHQVCM